MARMKLFCLPYAGASAMTYIHWKRFLHADIEIVPLELAGRGKRYGSEFYNDFEAMVEDVYGKIQDQLDDIPYSFFGHSMGSWLAFELSHTIMRNSHKPPVHIFFSARRAPHISRIDVNYNELPNDRLQDALLELGGTPIEVLENKDLMKTFLPILLSDFKVMSTYKYAERSEKLKCGISVLSGKEDKEILMSDLLGWKIHSNVGCTIYKLPGGHFFQNENVEQVIKIINETLLNTIEATCYEGEF